MGKKLVDMVIFCKVSDHVIRNTVEGIQRENARIIFFSFIYKKNI